MKLWNRAKAAAKGAYAVAQSEPKHLATQVPLLEEAISLLQAPFSFASLEECQYLLTQAQTVVIPWRPSKVPTPGVLYVQPAWARNSDEQLSQALSLLAELKDSNDVQEVAPKPQECTMKVFLSHSSKDKVCAEALVDLLRAAIGIHARDIRCTSVDGYKLPAGADSNEVLRAEVFGCDVFIGLLSPASMSSVYVMFELGARWGSGKYLAPLRVSGLTAEHLKPPISAIHVVDGSSEAELHQLLRELSSRLALPLESPAVYLKQLKSFLASASSLQSASHVRVKPTKLRDAILTSISELEAAHGKAESMRLINHLAGSYDFGTVLGELMQLRDAGIVRWDGNQDAPAAYVGIELVQSA
ncbi:toll/interleukin-1 receptor domain-containing protein [Xanthomonadaceae bacterium XH05]|nr:toll/interleukin-1 receptor domain-containing protein [Xanthomonadaceae bacterium XH05]